MSLYFTILYFNRFFFHFISGYTFDYYGWNESICSFQSLIKYRHLCEIQCVTVCAYESHFKWIWNFVDFWDDVICYRFELRSYFLWPLITCSHKCFVILTFWFCFSFRFVFRLLRLLDAQVSFYLQVIRFTTIFVNMIKYFWNSDRMTIKILSWMKEERRKTTAFTCSK